MKKTRRPTITLVTIGLLATPALSQQAKTDGQPHDEPVMRREKVSISLDVPDELVPAVLPYMLCVQAKTGAPVQSDGKPLDLSKQPADCGPVRAKALTDGVEILRRLNSGGDDSAHQLKVSEFLDQYDYFSRLKSQAELEAMFAKQREGK